MAQCIRLDLDCAETCRLASAFMGRGSDFVAEIAGHAHGYAKRAGMNVDVTKRRIARIVPTHALDAPTRARHRLWTW
jgi:hypothetical protein